MKYTSPSMNSPITPITPITPRTAGRNLIGFALFGTGIFVSRCARQYTARPLCYNLMRETILRSVYAPLLFLLFFSFGCANSSISKATQGALAGAAVGAGTGAIVGNQSGHSGAGVAIGAGIGALTGAFAGHAMDREDQQNRALEGQLSNNQQQLEENRRMIEELRARGADAHGSKRGVVINLPDILFEFDRARLTPEAYRTLSEITSVLRKARERSISVEGHTDSIGTIRYNKRLSISRAQRVADELSSQGIARGQLSVRGLGEAVPIATNNSDAGRERNRRVEIIVEN